MAEQVAGLGGFCLGGFGQGAHPNRLPCPEPPPELVFGLRGFHAAVTLGAGGAASPTLRTLCAVAATQPSVNSMSRLLPGRTGAAERNGWPSWRTSAKPRSSTL